MKTKITQHTFSKTANQWGRKWLLASAMFLGAFCFSAHAQTLAPPAIEWDKTFGGDASDISQVVKQTKDGGYIVGGRSDSGISSDKTGSSAQYGNYWIVKVDASGKKQWDHSLDAGGNLNALELTSDGGYIAGGYSNKGKNKDKSEDSRGGFDYWIVKFDASGNKEWDRTYGGADEDVLYDLKQTSDGGYILGGASGSNKSIDKSENRTEGSDCFEDFCLSDYWVIKVDASGNKEWDRTYGGTDQDVLNALQQTKDGGYILGGESFSGVSGNKTEPVKGVTDYWVVKINATGEKQWERSIGGPGGEALRTLQQTTDGGYILGGDTDSDVGGDKTDPSNGGYDFWLVKLDAAGIQQWDRSIGGSSFDLLLSLQQTTDGGYILGGYSASSMNGDKTEASRGGSDFWVVKVDDSGNKEWDKTLGGAGNDVLNSLQQTTDSGYILAGYSYSNVSGDKTEPNRGSTENPDYWVIKLQGEATAAKPEIAAFKPSMGLPGAIITLTGKHLLSTTAITLNGVRAGFKIINDCELKIAVPVAATTGKIEITTTNGTVLSKEVFTVLQPNIVKLTPPVGGIGSRFAIRGNHLSSTKQILVNGVAVTEFTVVDNTLIRAVVPEGASTGKVTLALKGGAKITSSESFRVLATGADKVAETKNLMAYPNPFVAGVTLPVSLDKAGPVSVLIYNTKGQQVKALKYSQLQAGEHQLEWDGKDGQNRPVTEGLYFYKLHVNGKLTTGQLLKSGR